MRVIRFAGAALVAALLLGTPTSAGAGSAKRVTCSLQLQTLAPPGASGEHFGTVTCEKVLGKGVHYGALTIRRISQTTGTVTGSFRQFFRTGTIHGRVKLTFSATITGAVTYVGLAGVSGGTGAYKDVRGRSRVWCHSEDAGTRIYCTQQAILTRF